MDTPPRHRWTFAWVGPLTFVVHALGARPTLVGVWGDDALYLSMADSLRRGGPMVAEVLPGAPGIAKYPLLFPAVLAAFLQLGASIHTILLLNAALWALAAQLVVSALMPALGAGWRARLAAGVLIAVNTMTMNLVPQVMSEALFTLALTAAVVLVVQGPTGRGRLLALGACVAIAAGTRNVGGLYALGGVMIALAARRPAVAAALGSGWAVAAVGLRLGRSMATLPVGDALALVRYYVSYDVHTGWYAERWAEGGPGGVLAAAREVVTANVGLGPKSLDLYLAPSAGGAAAGAAGGGATLLGPLLLGLAAVGAARVRKARPVGALVLIHVAVFLLWTWPFSARFWLPIFPLLVALAALALDGLGNIGRLLVLPVAGLVTLFNGLQPYYVGRSALLGPAAAPVAEGADAALAADEAALAAAVARLAELVRPGDALAGGGDVFWLARPLGASAIELRNLVPFEATLAGVLHLPMPPGADARLTHEFALGLRRLRAVVAADHRVWVACDPRRTEAYRGWMKAAEAAGELVLEAEAGSLRILSVPLDPPAK